MNERIVIDPKVCHGQPVVRGTRTPVTVILDCLAGGDSFEAVQQAYSITVEDIRACLAFAAEKLLQMTREPGAAATTAGSGEATALAAEFRSLEAASDADFTKLERELG